MIDLSESAVSQVRRLSADHGPEKRLRLRVEPGGCSGFEYAMSFDAVNPDDIKIIHADVELVVDPASFEYLDGCRVEFDDGLSGKGFEIINPNAQSTCGCGRSFN